MSEREAQRRGADLIIIEDTDEKKPLKFTKPYIDMVMRHKLNYGDYSCHYDGQVCPIFFERKSISDLFGTLGKGYHRFKKEINRAIDDGNRLVIIVEVSLTDIIKGYKHSSIKGEGIMRTLFTLMTRHHIPFVCCTSRREMALYISEFYYSWIKNRSEG